MEGRFLISSKESLVEGNVYADKSALILDWLLRVGIDKKGITLREVALDVGVSLGLVHRVFKILVLKGFLKSSGMRTAKRFFFTKPRALLENWFEQYNIVKKCKMWTYRSGFQEKEEILQVLKKSRKGNQVALALHSAAESYGCKNTNLNTLELYLLNPADRKFFENMLQLEFQERGYEVLLIEPYYKSWLNFAENSNESIKQAPSILTFLDLYHFPLRGQEQAEFMAQHIPELRRIYKNS